jgi:transposase
MMTPMEVKMIEELARRGASISAIAREVGRDRKTVRAAFNGGQSGTKKKEEKSVSILDPYKEYIVGRLEVADFTAQRLYQDIQDQGYEGGYDVVKRFVGPLRAEKSRQAVIRFETLPGQQGQVDWTGKFGFMELDGVRKRLSCFSMILGFSRYQYIEFTLSRNTLNFLSCHVHAFEYFEGIPGELLYDNLKTAILSNVDGVVEYQSEFKDFADYYGFTPRACRPYRAETKGKVERPFPYIRSNFFMGREFKDLVDLNEQAWDWLKERANCRIHGTTREKPEVRFEQEKDKLISLPEKRFRVVATQTRTSTRDCLISYEGNYYSVPGEHACRRGLRVEVSAEEVTIYHGEQHIARHALCRGKGHRIIDPKHLEGLKPERTFTPTQKRLEELRSLGLAAKTFVDGLVRTQTKYLSWHLKKLDDLWIKVGSETLQEAMKRAIPYEAFDAQTVENLAKKLRWRMEEPEALKEVLPQVLARLNQGEVQTRNLAEYDSVLASAMEE